MKSLYNKTISILGDSISTYKGISNCAEYNETIDINTIYYDGTFSLNSVDECWWKKLINKYNLRLIVNNSWSGSRVTTTRNILDAGCMHRSLNLHNNYNEEPDIILIYLGINDFNNNVELGEFPDDLNNLSETLFTSAYIKMVCNIKNKYKNSIIYCATLPYSAIKDNEVEFNKFNMTIRKIVKTFNLKLVDLNKLSSFNKENIYTYTAEGLHPNT